MIRNGFYTQTPTKISSGDCNFTVTIPQNIVMVNGVEVEVEVVDHEEDIDEPPSRGGLETISDIPTPVVDQIMGDGDAVVDQVMDDGDAVFDQIMGDGDAVFDQIMDDGDTVVDQVMDDGDAVFDQIMGDGDAVFDQIMGDGDTVFDQIMGDTRKEGLASGVGSIDDTSLGEGFRKWLAIQV